MKKIKIICIISLTLLIGLFVKYTLAVLLENDVEVEPDSELIYYLSIKYDGKDLIGGFSSDSVVSEVYSDDIYIEDKLPDGLTFTGFVTTDSGTIGAFRRNDETSPCLGQVVNDTNEEGNEGEWINNNTEFVYHGLHYNANTRKVSFRVNNLKAGCGLNVGIKTRTPSSVDDPNTVAIETRRDFYNFASVREKIDTIFSNVVHVFMGSSNQTLYSVTYEYENGTSANAPSLPPTLYFASGANVSVASDQFFYGYTFNGWTSNDVTISNGSFTMPSSNVVIKGSFTAKNSNKVIYSLTGTTPPEYVLPIEKYYYQDEIVDVDLLKTGDIINGYMFNGWTSNDVTITDGKFTMPNSNVSIVGSFSQITYQVAYEFEGEVIPDNSASLLPSTARYAPGTTVSLSTISEPSGYKFLGWYKENNFLMPNEDIIIYGEWKRFAGTFEPSISISDVTGKNYYRLGDKIRYKVTVANNSNFAISDIILKENLNGATFVEGNGFKVFGSMASIDEIGANSSFDLYIEYVVKSTDTNTVINNVDIIGAIADNYYELANQQYRASITSNLQSKLKLCVGIIGIDVGNSFKIKVSSNNYESSSILKKDECMTHYIDPGSYNIKEIVPQEYNLHSVTGSINSNDSNLNVVQGNNYQINFENKFKSKKFMHSFGDALNTVMGGQ